MYCRLFSRYCCGRNSGCFRLQDTPGGNQQSLTVDTASGWFLIAIITSVNITSVIIGTAMRYKVVLYHCGCFFSFPKSWLVDMLLFDEAQVHVPFVGVGYFIPLSNVSLHSNNFSPPPLFTFLCVQEEVCLYRLWTVELKHDIKKRAFFPVLTPWSSLIMTFHQKFIWVCPDCQDRLILILIATL